MKRKTKIISLVLAISLLLGMATTAYAASGTCEVFYFTYQDSVGEGGSASIQSCLSNLGYTANRYANTHAYYVRRTMNSDKVFAIVSHGAPGRVVCKDGVTTMSASAVSSDSSNYSLAAWFGSNDLKGMKFAYYGACSSAATDSTYGNLITYTTDTLGASCALGFTKTVYDPQVAYYEAQLFGYLQSGNSVSSANVLARAATYSQYKSYGNVDSALISGDSTTKIN